MYIIHPTKNLVRVCIHVCVCTIYSILGLQGIALAESGSFIPPAVPLVTCDPYFSIWSTGKTLAEVDTTHWTGRRHPLTSLIQIDGDTYRLMGHPKSDLPVLKQTGLEITPTRTIYSFSGAGVELEMVFLTPAIPYDIDVLSRPITYISYSIRSVDGKEHEASLLFSATGELAVNAPEEVVEVEKLDIDGIASLKLGAIDQQVLRHAGDDLRIEWGYLYLAAKQDADLTCHVGTPDNLIDQFVSGKTLVENSLDQIQGQADQIAIAITLGAGKIDKLPTKEWLVLAYDDIYSIEFMQSKLRPYWRRNGLDGDGLIKAAVEDYETLYEQCGRFDQELMEDLEQLGGVEFAKIAALAYRQCFAAGKFVADKNGQPIQFCKENNSNGCIGTSDVFYPMSPQFLLFGSSLAKSFVVPFMEYAASDRWRFPFAPHDLGTYPKANGQVYGGGERSEENQMPVEESGNMLILMAAIAKIDGDTDFADRYWPLLQQWAEYLKDKGFDPENQLCTDDFAGHMAHNVNLSAKAICGLGAYSLLCEMRGDRDQALEYRSVANAFAKRWIEEADDGDHFRLAFDKPGTWSQKYNLVWDRILGLNLFPDSIYQKEMDYYLKIQNRYGLPLDSRKQYTKLDWIFWTATLTKDKKAFEALTKPVYKFLEETPDRYPMTDWYETESGKQVGFKARPVVGGVFMQLLHDADVWKKWATRDVTKAGGYADMPLPLQIQPIIQSADLGNLEWRYTTNVPKDGWIQENYDDSQWAVGIAGFGANQAPNSRVATEWNTKEIWLRKKFDLAGTSIDNLHLNVHHDEDAEIYINGQLASKLRGYTTQYEKIPLSREVVNTLLEDGNVIAVHCRQSMGAQYIDVGLVEIEHED